MRLAKYAKRGFAVAVPGLRLEDVRSEYSRGLFVRVSGQIHWLRPEVPPEVKISDLGLEARGLAVGSMKKSDGDTFVSPSAPAASDEKIPKDGLRGLPRLCVLSACDDVAEAVEVDAKVAAMPLGLRVLPMGAEQDAVENEQPVVRMPCAAILTVPAGLMATLAASETQVEPIAVFTPGDEDGRGGYIVRTERLNHNPMTDEFEGLDWNFDSYDVLMDNGVMAYIKGHTPYYMNRRLRNLRFDRLGWEKMPPFLWDLVYVGEAGGQSHSTYTGSLQHDAPHVYNANSQRTNYYDKVLSKFLPATIEFTREPFPGRVEQRTVHGLGWFGDVHTP